MADLRKHSNTSNLVRFKLTKSTDGTAFTGATLSSSGLVISTIADDEATATTYTQAGSTIETIATLGTFAAPTTNKCRFKEVDATNHPGLYELQFADARFAVTNARRMVVSVSGVTGLFSCDYEIQLLQVDLYDTVRMGLTALPAIAVSAIGGLLTAPTTANVGTVDLVRILGTLLTETSGQIAAGFKKFFNIATPTGTVNSLPDAVPGTSSGLPLKSNIPTASENALAVESVVFYGGLYSTIERSIADDKEITFQWATLGATITAEVSIDNGAYVAAVGAVAFLRTEGGKYYYTLAFNAADRPADEGTARYKFDDGVTSPVYLTLRTVVAELDAASISQIQSGLATESSLNAYGLVLIGVQNDVADIKGVTEKINTGLVLNGAVWQFTVNMLELGPSGSGDISSFSGDALSLIQAALTAASAVIPEAAGTITGFPAALTIGDSYITALNNFIKVYVRDSVATPLTGIGLKSFIDADFTAELTVSQGSKSSLVTAICTWIPAAGPVEGYLKVQFTNDQTRRATEGSATLQLVFRWDGGIETTIATQTVEWEPRVTRSLQ